MHINSTRTRAQAVINNSIRLSFPRFLYDLSARARQSFPRFYSRERWLFYFLVLVARRARTFSSALFIRCEIAGFLWRVVRRDERWGIFFPREVVLNVRGCIRNAFSIVCV